MTRSRICPDTESTGLSPASDALPVRETTEQFAQVFFGKSVSLLTPEERFTTVYAGSRGYTCGFASGELVSGRHLVS
ncbi:putative cytoplasmic protein, partial [Salmonella enterica subsp. enterica serovar Enteritidis str. 543463 40-18]